MLRRAGPRKLRKLCTLATICARSEHTVLAYVVLSNRAALLNSQRESLPPASICSLTCVVLQTIHMSVLCSSFMLEAGVSGMQAVRAQAGEDEEEAAGCCV